MTDTTVETTVDTTATVITPTPTEPKLVELARDPKKGGHGAHRVLVPADEIDAWLSVGWYRA